LLETVTTAEEVEEAEEITPKKENTLITANPEEVMIEAVAVTMTTATPEDPAPHAETPETTAILEETMIAEEMTTVAILLAT
jgi:hypothetical protein